MTNSPDGTAKVVAEAYEKISVCSLAQQQAQRWSRSCLQKRYDLVARQTQSRDRFRV
jgi:hypothetical protein